MIRLLQAELGPQAELFFLMGMDSLANILTWHEPARLLEACRLIVACRPGIEADWPTIRAALPQIEERVLCISMPLIEISGGELRRRRAGGLSIRYQTPEAVRRYIESNQLYEQRDADDTV
jgi:nicotinate-nucleotide adenylyltransferase